MFDAGTLTFHEFATNEPLPLAKVHRVVLEFLRDRDDSVVSGAQGVNAYVREPRMTQDVDLLSMRPEDLAEALREYLGQRFEIELDVREIGEGRGYRLFQVQKAGNRHLVDVRPIETLPSAQRVQGVLVLAPPELIASKVVSYYRRRGQPKSGTDWRDIAVLLLRFPELKTTSGPVADALQAAKAEPEILAVWRELVAQEIQPPDEDDKFQ